MSNKSTIKSTYLLANSVVTTTLIACLLLNLKPAGVMAQTTEAGCGELFYRGDKTCSCESVSVNGVVFNTNLNQYCCGEIQNSMCVDPNAENNDPVPPTTYECGDEYINDGNTQCNCANLDVIVSSSMTSPRRDCCGWYDRTNSVCSSGPIATSSPENFPAPPENDPASRGIVGCGEIFLRQENSCSCLGISADGVQYDDFNHYCCGEIKQGIRKECVDPATGEVGSTSPTTYECGNIYQPGSNTSCNCSNEDIITAGGMGVSASNCCGWYITKDNVCLASPADGYKLCTQATQDARDMCRYCANDGGIWTAVGCIPTEPEQMVEKLILIGLLTGGGVSLIVIMAGAFILSTSQGDPKRVGEAKELITSALIGLVFIIFSISLLQLIGVQILHIPGFGE